MRPQLEPGMRPDLGAVDWTPGGEGECRGDKEEPCVTSRHGKDILYLEKEIHGQVTEASRVR